MLLASLFAGHFFRCCCELLYRIIPVFVYITNCIEMKPYLNFDWKTTTENDLLYVNWRYELTDETDILFVFNEVHRISTIHVNFCRHNLEREKKPNQTKLIRIGIVIPPVGLEFIFKSTSTLMRSIWFNYVCLFWHSPKKYARLSMLERERKRERVASTNCILLIQTSKATAKLC